MNLIEKIETIIYKIELKTTIPIQIKGELYDDLRDLIIEIQAKEREEERKSLEYLFSLNRTSAESVQISLSN